MAERKLTRAERRRQRREAQKEPASPFPDDLDPGEIAAMSSVVSRVAGFCEGYIVGKIGIEGYHEPDVQEVVELLPQPHCEDRSCRACRLAMEGIGYYFDAENDEEAYHLGRDTLEGIRPPDEVLDRQRLTSPMRLSMRPPPTD